MLWTLPYGNIVVGFLQFSGVRTGALAGCALAMALYAMINAMLSL